MPIVLVAEELSPAGIALLESDFEVRHSDGADRAAAAAGHRRRRRDPRPLRDQGRRRGHRRRPQAQGRRPRRRRPRQRRRPGRDQGRRDGRQRADLQHRHAPPSYRSRCCSPAPATSRRRQRRAQGRRVEAHQVHRRRARRARPRRASASAASACWSPQRLRRFGMKLVAYDPYVPGRPRRADGRPAGHARRTARRVRLHHRAPAEDPGDPRPDRRRGAAQGQALACGSSTPRAAASSTRHALAARAQGGPGRRRGHRRLRQGAVHRLPAVRLRQRGRHPAPGRLHRRGAGEGRHSVARSVRLALAGELVPDAVNVQGGAVAEDVRPGPAAGREARPDLHRAGRRRRRPARRRGRAARSPSTTSRCCELSALKGVFEDVVEETGLLRQRAAARAGARPGGRARPPTRRAPTTATWSPSAARWPTAQVVSVSGTLTGPKQIQKIVDVDGFDVDSRLTDAHGVLPLRRPARRRRHPRAAARRGRDQHRRACRSPATRAAARRWSSLTVDSEIPQPLLAEITAEIGAVSGRARRPGTRSDSGRCGVSGRIADLDES